MKVLIVGSGANCREVNTWNTSGYSVFVMNNAWKAVNNWDYLYYPGDFHDLPTPMEGKNLITGAFINHFLSKFNLDRISYHATALFSATYFAMYALKPKLIGYIGTDMNYSIEGNAFYGKSIPDPLRFGEEVLNLWLKELVNDAKSLKIKLVNFSNGPSRLPFERVKFSEMENVK